MINFASMKKTPFIIAMLLLAAACGSKKTDADLSQPGEQADAVSGIQSSQPEEGAVKLSAAPRPGATPYANPVGSYREVFNDSNYRQYEAAERIGIDPIEELYQTVHTKRPIVKMESGQNFKIDSLTHSFPYLVPEAAQLLDEIGEAFRDSIALRGGDPSHRIIVTSLLRTPHSVKKLRRVNRNAVDSSTHVFGTTFDISWNHFDVPDSVQPINFQILKGILAEVLLAKRQEGKCYVKYEHKSPCFHITVR